MHIKTKNTAFVTVSFYFTKTFYFIFSHLFIVSQMFMISFEMMDYIDTTFEGRDSGQ